MTRRVKKAARDDPRLCPHWSNSRYFGLIRLREAIEKVIADHVAPRCKRGAKLVAVDMGCGTMPYRPLFEPFVKYLGADLADNKDADLAIDAKTGRVNLAAASADLVISTQVLEHVESPAAYLKEAHRLCKPDGLLILSTHGFWQYHPHPTDYWRWTAAGLCKLLREHGWQPIDKIGVLGFAAAAICLLQDALADRIPQEWQSKLTLSLQQLVGLFDSWYSPEERQENAAVYLVVARRLQEPAK